MPRSPNELAMPTSPPRAPARIKSEREPQRTSGFVRFLDGLLSFVFIVLLLSASVGIWLRQSFDAPGPLAQSATLVVSKGEGALEVAERLERAGIVADRRVFMMQYYAARLTGAGSSADRTGLKAGE
jgi:UPF0755 protein